MRAYVLRTEADLIGMRIIEGSTTDITVIPIILDGDRDSALPGLVRPLVWADFRGQDRYFVTMFELILCLHGINPHQDEVAARLLRELMADPLDP
jgi:hypothetical protein